MGDGTRIGNGRAAMMTCSYRTSVNHAVHSFSDCRTLQRVDESVAGAIAVVRNDSYKGCRHLVLAFHKGTQSDLETQVRTSWLGNHGDPCRRAACDSERPWHHDAHVIVIHVRQLTATVTYTEVHSERLTFFQEMLKSHGMSWGQGRQAGGGPAPSNNKTQKIRRTTETQ
jgi:hypothetical protein